MRIYTETRHSWTWSVQTRGRPCKACLKSTTRTLVFFSFFLPQLKLAAPLRSWKSTWSLTWLNRRVFTNMVIDWGKKKGADLTFSSNSKRATRKTTLENFCRRDARRNELWVVRMRTGHAALIRAYRGHRKSSTHLLCAYCLNLLTAFCEIIHSISRENLRHYIKSEFITQEVCVILNSIP